MADLAYRNESAKFVRRTDWGTIWGGVFTFMAIWSVFGALGLAIFASTANPNAPRPVLGMRVGLGIWIVVLSIIAMYVAGRETDRLAAVNNRHDGLIHGMMMFGLSFAAVMVLLEIGGISLTDGAAVAGPHSPYVLTVLADLG